MAQNQQIAKTYSINNTDYTLASNKTATHCIIKDQIVSLSSGKSDAIGEDSKYPVSDSAIYVQIQKPSFR